MGYRLNPTSPLRKIGIVTEYFYPHLGGITEHVYYAAKEMARRGFEVVILTGFSGETCDVDLPPGIRVVRLGKSLPIFSNDSYAKVTVGWDLGKKIQRVLEAERFDLLHIHSPAVMVLPCLFGKYTNTVTIGTLHTYFDRAIFFRVFRRTVQRFLDKLDGIVAVSPSCIAAMERYFRFGPHRVIPNGVDAAWFQKTMGKTARHADGTANVFFLGRLDPRNGLDLLIDAFPRVLRRRPDARLIIAGDGPLKPLYEKMAGDLLGKNIFFEGAINAERPDYFAASQVFCYPATKASFGITLLESMAAGVPVIAADNPGFRDLIRDGETGLLASPGDPEALSQAIVRLLEDEVLSRKLKANGLKMAQEYAWPRVVDQLLAFYDEVYRRVRGVSFAA